MCGINAYSDAIKIFRMKDPVEMSRNSGASYQADSGVITLKYFGKPVRVMFPDGEIVSDSEMELKKNDKVLIIKYLVSACGVKPRGSWVPFLQLPDGPHHHVPFVNEALNPLAEDYGENLIEFRQRLSEFDAEIIKMGDIGAVIYAFPNVPLAVCIWEGDDEFPAKANILFDITAPLNLTTAALWVLGIELSRKLRNTEGQQYINANHPIGGAK